ncbi:MAG TPA: COR domain-containing protein [Flavilitoribacter sp.]|nr:COR domain-containing protein [Flavilitoribacter sp.]HMQ86896.1 COR domain-containing protein [Flavilitoribacter sp.]
MAYKAQTPKYLLDESGSLIGLNLASTNLTDDRWQNILNLLNAEKVRLRALNLNENKLTAFPPDQGLRELVYLDLSENGIQDLELPPGNNKLAHLQLDENPLENPLAEIIEQGSAAVLRYLINLKKEGRQDFLFEAKLLIIGEPGAGKTTFARRIQKETAPMPARKESTHGINIDKWEFEIRPEDTPVLINKSTKFHVNLWDFGGQDLYHGTHQFFFSQQSLYVLLADTREQKTDFSYWLNTLEQLAGTESSLFILMNKREDHKWKIDEPGIRTRFGDMLKESVTIDLSIPEEMLPLRERIRYWVLRLPDIGQELIESWVRIRDDLSIEETNFITFDRFLEICRNHGQTDPADVSLISRYFTRIGVFTHYIDDPNLRDRIYLNSNWLCKTVYKLLEDKTIIELNGRLNKQQVTQIWAKGDLVWEIDKLSALLERFGLMYQAGKEVFIIPEHLPQQQPYSKWEFENAENILHFRYRFDKYMPKGLMSRLIVSLHRHIKNQDLVWNRGFNIEYQGAKAEIIEDYGGNNQFDIRIAGMMQRDLLVIITQAFDQLLGQFEKLNPEKGIKCPCKKCSTIKDPYFHLTIDIEQALITKAHKPNPTVECKRSFDDIPIRDLLAVIDYEKVLQNLKRTAQKHPELSDQLDKVAKMVIELRQEIKTGFRQVNEKLGEIQFDQQQIMADLEQDKVPLDIQKEVMAAIQPYFEKLETLFASNNQTSQAKAVKQIRYEPEVKSKLKLTIPLIPFMVNYETELGWDWQKVKKSLVKLIT